jgi:hypothetical protein
MAEGVAGIYNWKVERQEELQSITERRMSQSSVSSEEEYR